MNHINGLDASGHAFGPAGLSKAELDPWPAIFGVLADLDSDGIVKVVSNSGLQVDWLLTEKEGYSHKTRIRAYLPRIQTAYAFLPEVKKLVVAALMAVELARDYPTKAMGLQSRLAKIGWRVDSDRLVPTEPDIKELFFPKGSEHDAYVEIRTIFQKASKSVSLIDPFVDATVFPLVGSIPAPTLNIQILTCIVPSDFVLEAGKFTTQHTRLRLEIRKTAEFHDRFIILDESLCFHIGASIKDAGKKAFMISQVQDESNRVALMEQLRRSWQAAQAIN